MVKGKLFFSVDHISAPSDVLWRFFRQGLSVRAIASELQHLGFTDSKSTVQRRVATMQRDSCIVSSMLKKKAKLLVQRTERRIFAQGCTSYFFSQYSHCGAKNDW
jgi:hypothetical protein